MSFQREKKKIKEDLLPASEFTQELSKKTAQSIELNLNSNLGIPVCNSTVFHSTYCAIKEQEVPFDSAGALGFLSVPLSAYKNKYRTL